MAIGAITNGEDGDDVRTKLNSTITKINKYFDTATDNRVVRTDGTTGGTQESSVTIDDSGTVNIPSGQNYQIDGVSLPKSSEVVLKSAYTPAYSLLAQQSGTGNPSVVTVANDRILGRKSGGGSNIEGLTASEAKAILSLTKSDVGLGNVDNTSDADKPVSTAQQTALDLKMETIGLACSDLTTDLTTGTSVAYYVLPYNFSIIAVKASLIAASTTDDVQLDVLIDGAGFFDATFSILEGDTTATASLTDTPTLRTEGQVITVDIATAGTDAKGLIVYVIGYATALP
jgi:hypothetical protein